MKTPILLIIAFLFCGVLYGQDEVISEEMKMKDMFREVEAKKSNTILQALFGITPKTKKDSEFTAKGGKVKTPKAPLTVTAPQNFWQMLFGVTPKKAAELALQDKEGKPSNLRQINAENSSKSKTKSNKANAASNSTITMFPSLAKAHRMAGEFEKAEIYYSRYITEDSDLEEILRYAQMLQSNGNCEDAVRWYAVFDEKAADVCRTSMEFIKDCDEIENWPLDEGVEVINLSSLNTEHIDFCAVPFNNGVVFTSTRDVESITVHKDSWTNDNFSNLFFADMDNNGNFTSPIPFKKSINKKYHDGVCSFSDTGNKMYFTRNNTKGKNKKGVIDLKIYSADYNGGTWSNVQELPINGDDFTSCHPTVTPDERFMFFASNRPGGLGGMDIWVSKNMNGTWAKPINLGPEVNSADNELFPFYGTDGLLYFSSNGHKGLGGLDIFYATNGNKEMTQWNDRTNANQPFNTATDDFGFFTNKDYSSGFFTSNRAGGKGKDDIYMWKRSAPKAEEMNVTIKDMKSGKTLNNVSVTLIEVAKGGSQLSTDKANKLMNKLPKDKRSFVQNSLKNMGGMIVNNSSMMSDNNGNMKFMWKPNTEYIMVSEKNGYVVANNVMTMGDMSGGNYVVKMNAKAAPKPPKPAVKPAPRPVIKTTPRPAPRPTISSRPVVRGEVITLDGILYDSNSSALRQKSKVELDKVVKVMKENPSLEIRFGAHTDSRGNDDSNLTLSQRRADAAMKYVVSKGISATRVRAAGYGEYKLKNNCNNGVNCDDTQHQMNRRTEVEIINFNSSGTIIRSNN